MPGGSSRLGWTPMPRDPPRVLERLAKRLRATLALILDAGIVISVVSGALGLARRIFDLRVDIWIQVIVMAAAVIVMLVLARSFNSPGESLFDTNYWHRASVDAEAAAVTPGTVGSSE